VEALSADEHVLRRSHLALALDIAALGEEIRALQHAVADLAHGLSLLAAAVACCGQPGKTSENRHADPC